MLEKVLSAARQLAGENPPEAGRVISLARLQAHPDVQRHVNTPARVIDIMNQLEEARLVRMVSRHPEHRWYVSAAA